MTTNETALNPVSIAKLLDEDTWLGYTANSLSQPDIFVTVDIDHDATGSRVNPLYTLDIARQNGNGVNNDSIKSGLTRRQVIEALQAYKPYKI